MYIYKPVTQGLVAVQLAGMMGDGMDDFDNLGGALMR